MAKIVNGQVQYENEALPEVGSSAYVAAQNGQIVPTGTTTAPITRSDLTPEAPLKLNQPKTSTGYSGLEASIESTAASFAEQEKVNAEKKSTETSKEKYMDVLLGRKTATGTQDKAYEAEGVDLAKKELTDINQQMIAEQQASRRRIEDIDKTFTGTVEGKNDEIRRVQRESVSKQADLAVIQLAKQNNYFGAKEIADRKIQAELEEDQNKLEAYKLDYEDNKEIFTKDEQRLYEKNIREKEKELTKKEGERKGIQAIGLEYLKEGGDSTTAQRIFSSETIDAAAVIAGSVIGSTDRAYKIAQIEKLKAEAVKDKVTGGAIQRVSNVNPDSPTYIQDMIAASAGGANPTGDQTKPISKALTVVGQLNNLQASLKNVDTGPIIGIFKSANPYDTQAQLIKAQLQAIIPNLARGVYGEVGVLTDNDIANYRQTLGNLKSKEELNDLLLAMTLTTVKNGVDDQLEVLASSGRDVSGFKNLHERLTEQVDTINARLGVTNDAPAPTSADQDYINSLPL